MVIVLLINAKTGNAQIFQLEGPTQYAQLIYLIAYSTVLAVNYLTHVKTILHLVLTKKKNLYFVTPKLLQEMVNALILLGLIIVH